MEVKANKHNNFCVQAETEIQGQGKEKKRVGTERTKDTRFEYNKEEEVGLYLQILLSKMKYKPGVVPAFPLSLMTRRKPPSWGSPCLCFASDDLRMLLV